MFTLKNTQGFNQQHIDEMNAVLETKIEEDKKDE